LGPNLHNIIGRKAGSLLNYGYSSAMKGADFVWDKEKLDYFIAKPDEVVPGNNVLTLPSVEPATPPTDCGSPQTAAVASVHGQNQKGKQPLEGQGLEVRTDRLPQWRPRSAITTAIGRGLRPDPERDAWPFHDLGVELSLGEISRYATWGLTDDCR
jgi:hypothetical protein